MSTGFREFLRDLEDAGELVRALVAELRDRPRHFGELVEAHMEAPWRDFLRAWGEVRAADVLERDDAGRYRITAPPS